MKCYVCNDNELPKHALYPFPRNPSRKKLWMKYCQMEVWSPLYRLCANHFVLKNFNIDGSLKKFAVPTVVENASQAATDSCLLNDSTIPQITFSNENQDSLKPKDNSDIDNGPPLLEIVWPNFSPPSHGLFEDTSSTIQFPQTSINATQGSLKSKHDSNIDEEIKSPIVYKSPFIIDKKYENVKRFPIRSMMNEGTSSRFLITKTSSEAIQDSLIPKCDSDTNKNVQHIIHKEPSPFIRGGLVNEERVSEGYMNEDTSNRLQIAKTSPEAIQDSVIPKRDSDTNKNVQHIHNLPSPFIAGGQHTELEEECSLSPNKNESTLNSVQIPQRESLRANQDSLKPKGDSDLENETPVLKIVRPNFSPPPRGLFEDTSSTIQFSQTNSPAATRYHLNSSKSSDDSDTNDSIVDGSNSDGSDSDGSDSDDPDSDDPNSDGSNPDGFNSDGSNSDDFNSDGSNADASNPDASNPDAFNADDSNPNAFNADDSNADYSSTDDSSTHDSDKDEEIQCFAYKSLPSTPDIISKRSLPPPEEEYENTLNNDHISQATSPSITTPINDSNSHAVIPNLAYYPSDGLVLRSIKQERCSPLPEVEYEETLNSVHFPQATSSSIRTPINGSNTHATIPNLAYYSSDSLALRFIKQERCSPPLEEEYADTFNSNQNWQQINQESESCHLEFYGSIIQESSPALFLSNFKTEPTTPTHEPSYGHYIDNYGNYENYENMETMNQSMYLPESHLELQYEDNIGEYYPENQTVVAESEINKTVTAELEIAELEPPKDLPMQPESSSGVDENCEMEEVSNTCKRKLNTEECTHVQLKHRVIELEESYKKLRQENDDLILELKILKTSGQK